MRNMCKNFHNIKLGAKTQFHTTLYFESNNALNTSAEFITSKKLPLPSTGFNKKRVLWKHIYCHM